MWLCAWSLIVPPAFRSLHSSNRVEQVEQEAQTRVPVPPETGVPVTRRAQAGSLQLGLETPQNKAGSTFLIVTSLRVTNHCLLQNMYFLRSIKLQIGRGRVLCGPWLSVRSVLVLRVVHILKLFLNFRSCLLCCGDDAYGCCKIRPR